MDGRHSNEEPYSNRELDTLLKGITAKIDEAAKDLAEQLDRIEEQTVKTNGRVSTLERWRSWATGALAVFTPVLIFVTAWFYTQITAIK